VAFGSRPCPSPILTAAAPPFGREESDAATVVVILHLLLDPHRRDQL
jgi:hypothetical protein